MKAKRRGSTTTSPGPQASKGTEHAAPSPRPNEKPKQKGESSKTAKTLRTRRYTWTSCHNFRGQERRTVPLLEKPYKEPESASERRGERREEGEGKGGRSSSPTQGKQRQKEHRERKRRKRKKRKERNVRTSKRRNEDWCVHFCVSVLHSKEEIKSERER